MHGRDAEPVVPLLERPIGRAGAADDFADAPALSGREVRSASPRPAAWRARRHGSDFALHGPKIAIFPKRETPRELGFVRRATTPSRPAFGIRRNNMFDHVSIGVRDIAQGQGLLRRGAEAAWIYLPQRRRHFARLRQRGRRLLGPSRRSARSPTIRSPGFTSASPRRAARASRRSMRRRWRMADATTASRACARITVPHYYAAFVVDPDGYRLEAYYEREMRWRRSDPNSTRAPGRATCGRRSATSARCIRGSSPASSSTRSSSRARGS